MEAWFFVSILGVVGALIGFTAIIGLGTLIVRCLRLPNDPPFDALFSCPAPALIIKPNRELALAQAAQQQQLQSVYEQAKFLCFHALQCHDAVNALGNYEHATDQEKQALKELAPIDKQLKEIPDKVEKWLKQGNLGEHQQEIQKWYKKHEVDCVSYKSILDALPPPSKKRLYLLVGALLLSFGLLILAHLLAQA